MSLNIDGHLDGVSPEGWVGGWAHAGGHGSKVQLHVVIDGRQVASITGDQFRPDLAEANFPDPSCAFVYRIPDDFWDGREHSIEVLAAETGGPIRNSPLTFTLKSLRLQLGARDDKNFIPNAKLSHWPDGSFLKPVEKFSQVAAGWYFDFKQGSAPNATFCIDRSAGLGLRDDEYALKVTLGKNPEPDYRRIVVPISIDEAGHYLFSCGFRRPHTSVTGHITIGEIFLGSIEGSNLTRLASIKKQISPQGTVRLANLLLPITTETLSHHRSGNQLALVFEFNGDGEILIFAPRLATAPTLPSGIEQSGSFEDPRIQDQSSLLMLPSRETRPSARETRNAAHMAQVNATNDDAAASGHPFIQIIVPVFNGARDTAELVTSIQRHTKPPYEVLLFDDGSDPHTRHYLQRVTATDSRIAIFTQDENVGYTRNINMALQSTTAEFVMILNSDAVVTPDWLDKLYEVIAQDPLIAGVGPISNAASWQSVPEVKSPRGSWAVNELPAGYSIDEYAELVEQLSEADFPEFPLLNGFCTLFRRSALEAVGLFDDLTFPHGYGEENDLCIRLRQAGFRLGVADHTYVYHKKSRSFGAARRTELSHEASAKLRAKFPSIRIDQLENQMAGNASLNILRLRLRNHNSVEHRAARGAAK